MFESLFIVLRECAELLLIVVTMRAYLQRRARADLLPWLYASLVAGFSLGLLSVVFLIQHGSKGYLTAILSLLLGLSVLFFATAILSSQSAIDRHVRDHLADHAERPTGIVTICAFAAFAAFRESLELGVFLRSASADHGFAAALQGTLIGVAMVAASMLVLRTVRTHWAFSTLFRISTLLLCLLAIQLTLEGLSALLILLPAVPDITSDDALAWLLTPGSAGYAYLCAALMIWPFTRVFKSWWAESSRRSSM